MQDQNMHYVVAEGLGDIDMRSVVADGRKYCLVEKPNLVVDLNVVARGFVECSQVSEDSLPLRPGAAGAKARRGK